METINSFDYLIALIRACQEARQESKDYKKDGIIKGPDNYYGILGGTYYLLDQSVRMLWNKKGHKCVSKKALELWNQLEVGDSIFNYYYQKPIYYKNKSTIHIKYYKGASSEPEYEEDVCYDDRKKNYFKFRQVFHMEHIVPISVIIEQLLNLDISLSKEDVYREVNKILDQIYVCYMLKEEDRMLNQVSKSNRSNNYKDVLENDYKKAGIEIAAFDYD